MSHGGNQSHDLRRRLEMTDEPFNADRIDHMRIWCRQYFREIGEPALLRFNIGTYQLHQANVALATWPAKTLDEERLYTSYAAAIIHWHTACEGVGADTGVGGLWSECNDLVMPAMNAGSVLAHLAAATQQLCYLHTCKPGTVRYSRIDKSALAAAVALMSLHVIREIPASKRAWAFQIEMDRLIDNEWKAKAPNTDKS